MYFTHILDWRIFTIRLLAHIRVCCIGGFSRNLGLKTFFTTRTADQRLVDFINNNYTETGEY